MTIEERKTLIDKYKSGKTTEVVKDGVKVKYIAIDKNWLRKIIKDYDKLRV